MIEKQGDNMSGDGLNAHNVDELSGCMSETTLRVEEVKKSGRRRCTRPSVKLREENF